MIRLLLEANPGVASMTDTEGYTALHYACENEVNADVIECLLNAYREAACVVSRKQDTALHIACSANASSETVRHLIEAYPAALTKTNHYGFTPLHCVCRAYLPRAGIVQAVIEACPDCIAMRTYGGETPMHLACSSGAYAGVLKLLTDSQSTLPGPVDSALKTDKSRLINSMTNKIGNTPLHEACFRGAGFESIETLARNNPEWIMVWNNAGYTPLQILCKGGRLDERIVTSFSCIRGPQVFTVVDQTGHTPLHSASREGTDVAAIQSLIRAYPDALKLKTLYGDTPLHLACLRSANVDVVRLIAESIDDRRASVLLEPNGAGQTPLGIAMEAFQGSLGQVRDFEVLTVFVNLLFYGLSLEEYSSGPPNLVRACVSLHRRDVRLHPAFIRRAIQLHPEDVRTIDEEGNYPLHIEASIPIEKMSLLDSPIKGYCSGSDHTRIGILEILLEAYPEALCVRNVADEFPLGLMIQNGRPWSHAFALALRTFPAALHWYHGGINDRILPDVLAKVSSDCGTDSLFQLLIAQPSIVRRRRRNIPE
jgi:ankyrin repeat protein